MSNKKNRAVECLPQQGRSQKKAMFAFVAIKVDGGWQTQEPVYDYEVIDHVVKHRNKLHLTEVLDNGEIYMPIDQYCGVVVFKPSMQLITVLADACKS